MRYDIELAPAAQNKLRSLPEALRGEVIVQLYRLAEAPAALSRPSITPPEPPGHQVFPFTVEHLGALHQFRVLFQYGADESTLWVYAIGHIEFGNPP